MPAINPTPWNPKQNLLGVIEPAAGEAVPLSTAAVASVVVPKLSPIKGHFSVVSNSAVQAFAAAPPSGRAVPQQGQLPLVASFKTRHPVHFHCPGFSCINLARGFAAPLREAAGVTAGISALSFVAFSAATDCSPLSFVSFWLNTFTEGSRMLGEGESTNRTWASLSSTPACFTPSPPTGSVNLNPPIVCCCSGTVPVEVDAEIIDVT